jgi:hypothetical protein
MTWSGFSRGAVALAIGVSCVVVGSGYLFGLAVTSMKHHMFFLHLVGR